MSNIRSIIFRVGFLFIKCLLFQLGIGYYPDGELLQYADSEYHEINSISMSSGRADDYVTSYWQISETQGKLRLKDVTK